jgi:2'-hydroxyisoflavone reductase
MKILILGGTVFVGRHLTELALTRGHEITLFNRGRTNPDAFADVEQLRGDRLASDLSALAGRQWDAVIDTCGYVPRVVTEATQLLRENIGHYTFISTLSVYSDNATANQDETAPVGTLDDPTTEEVNGDTYGPLKVLCEQAAEAALPGRVLIIRPGLIVGPYDPTDRFTYWPVRVGRGGTVLAPGQPNEPVQFIDGRDLARFTLDQIEAAATGTYNATGPAAQLPMQIMLETSRAVSDSNATFEWVDEAFLLANDVRPYVDMPLWVPTAAAAFGRFNIDKALAAGLIHRPLAHTLYDTLAWHETRPADHVWRAGLSAEREQALLQAWQQSKNTA